MSAAPLPPTPGQTVGPFFHYSLPWPGDADLVPPVHPGAVVLRGTVTDGDGAPVPDALVEVWQAAPDGTVPQQPGSLRRDGRTFTGFGRCATDAGGGYAFTTLLPGPHRPGAAPFFAVTVFARGLLHRLLTRAYLPEGHGGTAAALADDPLLARLGDVDPAARETLLCVAEPGPAGSVDLRPDLRFDVVLQGPGETAFLTYPRLPHGG